MKRIITIITALALAAFFATESNAQKFGAPEVMKGKFVAGGNLGLDFFGNCLYFSISPQLGYRLTRSLELGTRISYDMYYHYRDYYYGLYFRHYFSGSLYANYEIYRGIYVQVEDEETCLLVSGHDIESSTRFYNSLFVGAGYRQYFSQTGFVYTAFLYNLSWDYSGVSSSPYVNPYVIRVGYCYGF